MSERILHLHSTAALDGATRGAVAGAHAIDKSQAAGFFAYGLMVGMALGLMVAVWMVEHGQPRHPRRGTRRGTRGR